MPRQLVRLLVLSDFPFSFLTRNLVHRSVGTAIKLQLIARDRFGNNRGAWTPWGDDGLAYGGANDTLTLNLRNSTHAICNASSATHAHARNTRDGSGRSPCDPLIAVSWEWQESCGGCYDVTFE